jgi:Protein of unknown function (DUF2510)
MAPVSGWYADPSGVAELRFWDGQNWTPRTAEPAPSSPAISLPAPVVRVTAPSRSHRRQRSRPTPHGIAACLAVAALAVAVAAPFAMVGTQHARAASVQGSSTGLASSPLTGVGSLHVPAHFAGYGRVADTQARVSATFLTRKVPGNGLIAGAAYGTDPDQPRAWVVLRGAAVAPGPGNKILETAEQSVDAKNPNLVWMDQPTGGYGGILRCGETSQGTPGAICVFTDRTTFGVAFVKGPSATSIPLALALRAQAETTPVS